MENARCQLMTENGKDSRTQNTQWHDKNPIKYTKFTFNLCKYIDIAEIIIFMNVSIEFVFRMRNAFTHVIANEKRRNQREHTGISKNRDRIIKTLKWTCQIQTNIIRWGRGQRERESECFCISIYAPKRIIP